MGIINTRVSASEDDGYKRGGISSFSNNVTVNFGDAGLFDYSPFVRFVTVIPQGVTIDNAYIEFVVESEGIFGSATGTISGELSIGAVAPISASDYDSRARTDSTVNMLVEGAIVDEVITTSDLTSIVQEIVNQEGFSGILQFFIDETTPDNNYLGFYSYDTDSDKAALLHVEYTEASVVSNSLNYITNNIVIETYDYNGTQYSILDDEGTKFSNHYGEEGSGFGYITFTLSRKSGFGYKDFGHGYRVILRKGLRKILFDGIISKIDESRDGKFVISAVGMNTLFSFDIYNFIVADNRTNRWTAGCTAKGSYRPDKFDHSLNWTEIINEGTEDEDEISYDGIEIGPRKGIDYIQEDYYYIRYRFEFNETCKRIRFTYKLLLTNNWPGQVDILDASANVLWTRDVSGNGIADIDVDSLVNGNFVEVRFTVTSSGLNTAEEDTLYFRMWNIVVYSTDQVPDATFIAQNIAEYMYTNFGFSNDYSLLESIGYEIPQAAFDEDETIDVIMKKACSYGDGLNHPLAWGTAFDDIKRMFLHVQNTQDIRYKIEESEAYTLTGDLSQSYQKVYGKYTNTFGQTERTAVYSSQEQIDALGGLYRKTVIQLDDATPDQAITALELALSENKEPKISTSFTVSDFVLSSLNRPIPIEDVLSGGMVQVPEFRAREAQILDDKRQGYYTFMLISVEIDVYNRTATLTPAGDRSGFESYMETIRRMKE